MNSAIFSKARRGAYNRNIMIAVGVAIIIHLIMGLVIRGFSEPDVKYKIRDIKDYKEINLYQDYKKPDEPIVKDTTHRIIESQPVNAVLDSIPVVSDAVIKAVDWDRINKPNPNPDSFSIEQSNISKGEPVDAKLIKRGEVRYPRIARKNGIEGTSVIGLTVNENGEPVDLVLLQSSGSDILDKEAFRAAGKCEFIPAKQGGESVAQSYKLIFHFVLDGEEIIISN